ncbi:hypothetical protein IWQ60_007878, partial [Tieghemiomyces parasiticus]
SGSSTDQPPLSLDLATWQEYCSFSPAAWQAYRHATDPAARQADFDTLLSIQKRAAPTAFRPRLVRLFFDMRSLGLTVAKYHYILLLYALCRQGQLDDALALFAEIREGATDLELLEAYNVLLYGFGLARNYNGLLDGFFQIFRDRLQPDATTYHVVISAFQSEANTFRALEAFDSMLRSGVPPTLLLTRHMVFYLVGKRKFAEALRVYDLFGQSHVTEAEPATPPADPASVPQVAADDIYLHTALVYSALRHRDFDRARTFFANVQRLLRAEGTDPSGLSDAPTPFPTIPGASLSFNQFINYYIDQGDTTTVSQFFAALQLEGDQPDALSLMPLLRIYIGNRDVTKLQRTFEVLRTAHPTFDHQLSQVLVRIYAEHGKMSAAAKVPDQFIHSNLPVSNATYHAVIEGYVARQDAPGVLRALRLMQTHGRVPGLQSLELLVHFFLTNGYLALARPIYEYLLGPAKPTSVGAGSEPQPSQPEAQTKPTQRLFRLLIHQFSAAGELDMAMGFLEDMIALDLQPVEDLFHILMHAYIGQGQPERALELLPLMLQQPYFSSTVMRPDTPTDGSRKGSSSSSMLPRVRSTYLPRDPRILQRLSGDTFSVVVRALCVLGEVNEARELLRSSQSSLPAYNHVIHALVSQKKFATSQRLFQALLQRGHEPNQHTYSSLLRSSPPAEALQTAGAIFDHMVRKRIPLNTTLFTNYIEAHIPSGDTLGAERAFVQMQTTYGITPDPMAYLALMQVYRRSGQPVAGVRAWEELMARHPIQQDTVTNRLYPAPHHLSALSLMIRTFLPLDALKAGTMRAQYLHSQLLADCNEDDGGEPSLPPQPTKDQKHAEEYLEWLMRVTTNRRTFSSPGGVGYKNNGAWSVDKPPPLTLALTHLYHRLSVAWNGLARRGFPFTHLHYNDYFLALVYGYRIDAALDLLRGARIYVIGFPQQVSIGPDGQERAAATSEIIERTVPTGTEPGDGGLAADSASAPRGGQTASSAAQPTMPDTVTADWGPDSPAAVPLGGERLDAYRGAMAMPVPLVRERRDPPAGVAHTEYRSSHLTPTGLSRDEAKAKLSTGVPLESPQAAADPLLRPRLVYLYPVGLESLFCIIQILKQRNRFKSQVEGWITRMYTEHPELFR